MKGIRLVVGRDGTTERKKNVEHGLLVHTPLEKGWDLEKIAKKMKDKGIISNLDEVKT